MIVTSLSKAHSPITPRIPRLLSLSLSTLGQSTSCPNSFLVLSLYIYIPPLFLFLVSSLYFLLLNINKIQTHKRERERDMWMMGYNEDVNFPPESFTGRKLRPLVPRPAAASLSSPNSTVRLHKPDILSFNSHLGMVDQSKRELNTQQVVVTSRWNPTPEQLQTLEELYQRGTRTPSADQIQHITSQLRRYGKIEGKNVFYWFQNHKARERQKRRRQTESEPDFEQHQLCRDIDNNAQCKESGIEANNKTGVEIEQTKSCCWEYTSTSTTTLVPDLHQHQKTATLALKAAAGDPECDRRPADGWLPFDERELHQKSCLQRNATWQIFNRRFTNATITTTAAISSAVTSDTVDYTINPNFVKSSHDQTLQLFPLRSGDEDRDGETENDTCRFNSSDNYQFFEFLPVKKG